MLLKGKWTRYHWSTSRFLTNRSSQVEVYKNRTKQLQMSLSSYKVRQLWFIWLQKTCKFCPKLVISTSDSVFQGSAPNLIFILSRNFVADIFLVVGLFWGNNTRHHHQQQQQTTTTTTTTSPSTPDNKPEEEKERKKISQIKMKIIFSFGSR